MIFRGAVGENFMEQLDNEVCANCDSLSEIVILQEGVTCCDMGA